MDPTTEYGSTVQVQFLDDGVQGSVPTRRKCNVYGLCATVHEDLNSNFHLFEKYEKGKYFFNKQETMSIHFSSEVTVIRYTSENGTSVSTTSLVTFSTVHQNPTEPPEKHRLSDLDIMRRFIIQMANNSPTLFIEKHEDDEDEDDGDDGYYDDASDDSEQDCEKDCEQDCEQDCDSDDEQPDEN
jgi:hypothetical protein